MTSPDTDIKHYKDGALHGPVVLIVADDGRLGLHCCVDNQSWLLPPATPQTATKIDRTLPPSVRTEFRDAGPSTFIKPPPPLVESSIEAFAHEYLD